MTGQEKLLDEIDRLLTMSVEATREKRKTIICEVAPMLAILALAKIALNVGFRNMGDIVGDIEIGLIEANKTTEVQTWEQLHRGATREHLGLIPGFIDTGSDESLVTQLNAGYQHGGGYPGDKGWQAKWKYNATHHKLLYPGDPPFAALWRLVKGDEELIVFEHDIVMVNRISTSEFVVGRMD